MPLNSPSPRSFLTAGLAGIGITGALLAAVEVVLIVDLGGEPTWVLLLFPGIALLYLLVGIAAWRRRPANRIGPLLIFGGLTLLVAGLANVPIPAFTGAGVAVATLILGIVVHLLHTFPSGRLHGAASRAIVAAGYVVTLVIYAPQYLFRPGSEPPYATLFIRPDQQIYDVARVIGKVSISVVMALTAVVVARRVIAAPPRQRPGLGFVYLYGVVAVLALPFAANVLPAFFGFDPVDTAVTQLAFLGGVPVVIGFAMFRGELGSAGGVDVLVAAFGPEASAPQALEEALGAAIGDPTARLLFPGEPPSPAPHRGVVEVRHSANLTATVEYDALLFPDPDAVRPAARLVGLVLERDRLAASLRDHEDELRRSRDVVASAAETERRRIARDLHDGVQGRLTMLALYARSGEAQGAALAADIEATIDELRGLIAGVMPPVLIERGLGAALEDLVDLAPITVALHVDVDGGAVGPVAESTAYFVVAEAVTNTLKHAAATQLSIDVRQVNGELQLEIVDDGPGGAALGSGRGLSGLRERVTALGGALRIESPPAGGTRIVAEVPCES